MIGDIVTRALAEDLGDGDVTTAATVPVDARASALITQKAPGVVFGLALAEETFRALDPEVEIERLVQEGIWREGGEVLRVVGRARALLSAERTALNFLQRLSGVATLAARCVDAVQGTGAVILDTRKTTPGLRALEKAAVAAGGATNHRAGLYDAILIKENHAALAGGVGAADRGRMPLTHRGRRGVGRGRAPDPVGQHGCRGAARRGGACGRPRLAGGQRRGHPGDAPRDREHRRKLRLDGIDHAQCSRA
jgi:nicotinate-nucleotide pyrophosphorylase